MFEIVIPDCRSGFYFYSKPRSPIHALHFFDESWQPHLNPASELHPYSRYAIVSERGFLTLRLQENHLGKQFRAKYRGHIGDRGL